MDTGIDKGMQVEMRSWLQHYICCAKPPYRSTMKFSNIKRRGSKTTKREGSRVTFSRKVNKVEPLFIDTNGVLKQRSYISLLSSTSEDSIEEELRHFVEKYVSQTVYEAAAKYYREVEREMRLRNRSETKFNDVRKFSVIREETELSGSDESAKTVTEMSGSDFQNPYQIKSGSLDQGNSYKIGDLYSTDSISDDFSKEDSLSKSNLYPSSEEEETEKKYPESDSDSDTSYIDYMHLSSDEDNIDFGRRDTKPISPQNKVKDVKKKKVKAKPKPKVASPERQATQKKNKVEPLQAETSGERSFDSSQNKKKRQTSKKRVKKVVKKGK